jgi:hypothetical protein
VRDCLSLAIRCLLRGTVFILTRLGHWGLLKRHVMIPRGEAAD